jgi:predicted ArsR family transcriptional regulator
VSTRLTSMKRTSATSARGRGTTDRSERDSRVQRQAKALGDPTRHAIYRAVADAPGPMDVATLTARFGLNHNAIRQHLAKLCAAGLVVEEVAAPQGPGRPHLEYRPALAADADWGIPSPFEVLSLILLELVRTGRSPRQVGAEAGRRMAADLPDTADPLDRLEINAVRQGFEPRRAKTRSSIDLILGRCPFQAAASAAPEVICELHRGLAEGVVEATGGALEVTDLIARDPRKAGCRLKLQRTAPEPHP